MTVEKFKKVEETLIPLYNFTITGFKKLNDNPNIYYIEFMSVRLGCERREDGKWYGVTGMEEYVRKEIHDTLKHMGYEIIYKNKYKLVGYDRELIDTEIHIIKEREND